MKKYLLFGIPAILWLSVVSFYQINKPTKPFETKGLKPSEVHEISMLYPDFTFEESVVKNSIRSVMQQTHSRNPLFEGGWTLQGPTNIGGRISCLLARPNDPNVLYVGTPFSGIFKTTDGGNNWNPIFDDIPYLSVSSLEWAGNDLLVGTGDKALGAYFNVGNGIYRSSDNGNTWQNIGLTSCGIIPKITVPNQNEPNTIFVSAMGLPARLDNNRGLYKTTNGGQTWQQLLFVDDTTGVFDFIINPNNNNEIVATSMRRFRTNNQSIVSSNVTRIYKTTDGGQTWNISSFGLPDEAICKINLTYNAQTNTLFCSVVDGTSLDLNGIYRSNNFGNTWTKINLPDIEQNGPLGGFGWYFGYIYSNPYANELYLLGVDLWKSTDSGENWELATPEWFTYEVHADKHAMLFFENGCIVIGTDGGLYKNLNTINSEWTDIDFIPNSQFYRIEKNPFESDIYYGGMQDNGSSGGNLDNIQTWNRLWGGDGFQVRFDKDDIEYRYYETQNGDITGVNDLGSYYQVSANYDPDARKNWDTPYLLSHTNNKKVIIGADKIYENDGIWESPIHAVTPDLTDGNVFGSQFHNISALDESKLTQNLLYAGTSDANLWRIENYIPVNIQGTLPERYVSSIEASPNFLDNVYVTYSGWRFDDNQPYIFRSTNKGTTWTNIAGNLPLSPIYDVEIAPNQENIIFISNHFGVYATLDSGVNWERVGTNMPIFPVFDILIDTEKKELVAGTFARGIQTFDISSILENVSNTEVKYNNNIEILPTLTNDVVTIVSDELFTAKIYSITGEQLLKTTKNNISLLNLPNGIYWISVESKKGKKVQKLVKH